MKNLASIREQLLDLKIRVRSEDQDRPVPLQQDVRAIDYLREFSSYLEKKQLSAKQKEYIGRCGLEILRAVMEGHREAEE
jgi:hypothetical protein